MFILFFSPKLFKELCSIRRVIYHNKTWKWKTQTVIIYDYPRYYEPTYTSVVVIKAQLCMPFNANKFTEVHICKGWADTAGRIKVIKQYDVHHYIPLISPHPHMEPPSSILKVSIPLDYHQVLSRSTNGSARNGRLSRIIVVHLTRLDHLSCSVNMSGTK
jgi:hypothetical protein